MKPIETILSDLQKEDLLVYFKSHPHRFDELLQLALTNQPPHSARAAWMLSTCMTKNDSRVMPMIIQMIDVIPKVVDGQQRELINVLRILDLPEEGEGLLFDVCVQLWCDLKKIPSVRFKAFNYILSVCKKYPELKNELNVLSEDYYFDTLSDGIKRVLLKKLTEISG